MKAYMVGGAVRDALLGAPASDRDWVAVGAHARGTAGRWATSRWARTSRSSSTRRRGEEVALARTERKVGPGYHGFAFHAAPEVTLEEDLARRDLTINAIAQAEDGTLIDPHGGRRDIEARVLRHVSRAFVEDPVRLLRLARLAARLVRLHGGARDDGAAAAHGGRRARSTRWCPSGCGRNWRAG